MQYNSALKEKKSEIIILIVRLWADSNKAQ